MLQVACVGPHVHAGHGPGQRLCLRARRPLLCSPTGGLHHPLPCSIRHILLKPSQHVRAVLFHAHLIEGRMLWFQHIGRDPPRLTSHSACAGGVLGIPGSGQHRQRGTGAHRRVSAEGVLQRAPSAASGGARGRPRGFNLRYAAFQLYLQWHLRVPVSTLLTHGHTHAST